MSEADRDRTNGRRPGRMIAYCCVARAHWKKPASPAAANTVTIVEGDWAFCPHDAMLGTGHQWQATGGIAMENLRRMVRRGKPDEFAAAS
jgi:hypothetical protein